MGKVFISYSTPDIDYAVRVYQYLKMNKIECWFAPANISAGQNFAEEIGKALGWNQLEDEVGESEMRMKQSQSADAVVVLLSKNASKSKWVKKEIITAVNKDKLIIPLQLDHVALDETIEFNLADVQRIDAHLLPTTALDKMKKELAKVMPVEDENLEEETFTYEQLGIRSLALGDPYYIFGETLKVILGKEEFYLAPPKEMVSEKSKEWTETHFAKEDILPDLCWEEIYEKIPIADLKERIESSRKKVFGHFQNQENGCYFNNKKYGVQKIRPYGRTEDLREAPILELELFTTDYFTHRIMKDVCKQLIKEKNNHLLNGIKYPQIGVNRIFFTSLGINLLLQEAGSVENPHVILTSRSVNAAETYDKQQYSVSVIEGVSLSDYDPYLDTVDLKSAALRGINEELGVLAHEIKEGSLRFYEVFVNQTNLEMGLSCSIELTEKHTMNHILMRRGKDEQLEIAEKRNLLLSELKDFAVTNYKHFLPQAFFTICSYLDAIGVHLLERHHVIVKKEESSLVSKRGVTELCGDAILQGEHFMAVIDGATPKGHHLWDGMPGDVFVSELLKNAIDKLNPKCTAAEVITVLNETIKNAYKERGIDFSELLPEEQLQASVIIYSVARREIWNFGDCKLRINLENFDHTKKVDKLLSDLRTFCVELQEAKGTPEVLLEYEDYGRDQILLYLKEQAFFANTKYYFGYDVLNGGDINLKHIKIYAVQKGDHVVLASDGYPKLFDTLEESEDYLKKALKQDEECLHILRGTKGVKDGNESFDDRAFLSFVVY